MKTLINLEYFAIVKDISDGIATLHVFKSRTSSTGIKVMSVEHLDVLKDLSRYRIEKPINFESVDFESIVNVDLHENCQIDGFYVSRDDIAKISEIITYLR